MSAGRFGFELIRTDASARLGRMRTAHGSVDTPAFMPVATQGTVKSLTPASVKGLHVAWSAPTGTLAFSMHRRSAKSSARRPTRSVSACVAPL